MLFDIFIFINVSNDGCKIFLDARAFRCYILKSHRFDRNTRYHFASFTLSSHAGDARHEVFQRFAARRPSCFAPMSIAEPSAL